MQFSVDAASPDRRGSRKIGITLGIERGMLTMRGDPEPKPAFHTEPGDTITIARAQSRLMWPNWFETNWMSGNSPQWKRFVTYRVHWTKPSGASLDLFWRFEQPYYALDGWVCGEHDGPKFLRIGGRAHYAAGLNSSFEPV